MEKGFEIILNGRKIDPITIQIIFTNIIKPYDFITTVGSVEVKVTVGFFRNLTRQAELEEATEPDDDPRGRAIREAGLTVICNDRVVLISDKSTITGWGLASVPRYHPQFRAITGLITFSSRNAEELPISTTKRDLDTDTDIFNVARNAAIEGLLLFIGFTNQWKGSEEATDQWLPSEQRFEARSVSLAMDEGTAVRGSAGHARKFVPALPRPERTVKKRRVAFSRDVEEIRELGERLLGDPNALPGDVGLSAWTETLSRLRQQ